VSIGDLMKSAARQSVWNVCVKKSKFVILFYLAELVAVGIAEKD